MWTVYDHRRREPAFAAAWDEAERIGCALLEAEAVRQRIAAMEAIDFDIGETAAPDARRERDLEFWRTLHLLREHKRSLARVAKPGRRPRVATSADVLEALVKRLKAFGARMTGHESGGPLHQPAAGPEAGRSLPRSDLGLPGAVQPDSPRAGED